MKVAILSAGVSLKTTWEDSDVVADLLLAVNDAYYLYPMADWLVCCDAPRVQKHTIGPNTALCCFKPDAGKIPPEHKERLGCTTDQFAHLGEPQYTVCAALLLAEFLGAEEVVVFGHDCYHNPGKKSCIGAETPQRDDRMWKKERADWEKHRRASIGRGLVVRHIGPDGEEITYDEKGRGPTQTKSKGKPASRKSARQEPQTFAPLEAVPGILCPMCGRGMHPRVLRSRRDRGHKVSVCACKLCGKQFDYHHPMVRLHAS